MSEGMRSAAVIVAVVAFVVFLVLRLLPLGSRARRGPGTNAARERIAAAKRRGSDHTSSPVERAAAMREAALLTLNELRHPSLAASYARRAEKLDPQNAESVGLLATSLRRASRFVALERLLWRHLAEGAPHGPSYARALDELIALYAGPLKRPEIASALRGMRSPSS
jgi:hypothetical protein